MRLGLLGVLHEHLAEHLLGERELLRALEHALAAEAVALDPPKARGHQFVCAAIVFEGLPPPAPPRGGGGGAATGCSKRRRTAPAPRGPRRTPARRARAGGTR